MIKNLGAFVFSGTTGMLLSFLTGVYLARTLGASPYGQISFAIAITTYFYFVADFGINMYGTTKVSSNKESLMETIGTIYPLKLAMATAGFIVLCVISFLFIGGENRIIVLLYGASVFPLALAFDWVFQSAEKMQYPGLAKILYTGSMFVLVVLFVHSPEQLLLVPIFQFLGIAASTILMICIFSRQYHLPKFKFKVEEWKNIILSSLPYGVTGSLTMLVWYAPFIVLQYSDGSEAVGYFTAADQIISSLIAVFGWYFYCIYPVFVKNNNDANAVQNYSTRFVIGIITPMCVGGILLAKQIMVFVYGAEYLPAVDLLVLLMVSLWFLILNQIYIFGMFSIGKQKVTTRIFAIQCVGTMILCALLIPAFSAVGAAIAAIGCEVIALPLFHLEFRKTIRIDYLGNLVKAGVASLFMVVAIVVLQTFVIDNMISSIAIGGIVFLAAAVCVKLITKEDISKIMHRGTST